VFAWIATCAGIAIIAPQFILGLAIFGNTNYVPKPWHAFIIYQAANTLVLVYNIYALKRSMWIHDVGCKWTALILVHVQVENVLIDPLQSSCQ
jgi:choline transport protein